MVLTRHPDNPIITRESITSTLPELDDVSSVFNPGAVLVDGKVHLLLRVQNRGRETYLLHAVSDDGVQFDIDPEPVVFKGIEEIASPVYHIYDPRITELDGRYYIMLALDIHNGCRLGLAVTDDFREYEFLGIKSHIDNRNGVLFPERINGQVFRLDRPNHPTADGPASGEMIWLVSSRDFTRWIPHSPVLQGRPHYWDERIGSGPPPVKTRDGWLLIYHGVATHFSRSNIYQAGVALLDLEDPCKLIGRTRYNILEPREMYELIGQVPNVVFPSGMVVWDTDDDGYALPDSRVSIYYGAADTVVGLAETTIGELVNACNEA